MTDDECIALASLHGAYFWHDRGVFERNPDLARDRELFFAIDAGYDELHGPPDKNLSCVWYSQGKTYAIAARKYCERHGLLDEVT